MTESRDQQTPDASGKRESGEPGGGAGRRDEVGGSGVYPASAGRAPEGAEIRNLSAWGQGDRGAAGYDDSGESELYFSEAELKAVEQERRPGSGDEPTGPEPGS